MADTKKVVIEIKKPKEAKPKHKTPDSNSDKAKEKNILGNNLKYAAKALVGDLSVRTVQSVLDKSVNLYSTFSGDYITKSAYDMTSKIVFDGISLGIQAAVAGPLAPAVVAVAGVKKAMQIVQYEVERQKDRQQVDFIKSKTGGLLTDGSR